MARLVLIDMIDSGRLFPSAEFDLLIDSGKLHVKSMVANAAQADQC